MRFLSALVSCIAALFMTQGAAATDANQKTAYDFSFTGIDGSPMPLSQFRGKVLLVVNTASECGFTEQYAALEKLYQEYKDKGLIVIGVPSNDFGRQEPGSSEEIKQFCESKFHITFPLTEKAIVKGEGTHPFYQWVRDLKGPLATPKWNFHKYLISADGRFIDFFLSATEPGSERLKKAIEKELKKVE